VAAFLVQAPHLLLSKWQTVGWSREREDAMHLARELSERNRLSPDGEWTRVLYQRKVVAKFHAGAVTPLRRAK